MRYRYRESRRFLSMNRLVNRFDQQPRSSSVVPDSRGEIRSSLRCRPSALPFATPSTRLPSLRPLSTGDNIGAANVHAVGRCGGQARSVRMLYSARSRFLSVLLTAGTFTAEGSSPQSGVASGLALAVGPAGLAEAPALNGLRLRLALAQVVHARRRVSRSVTRALSGTHRISDRVGRGKIPVGVVDVRVRRSDSRG